MPDAHKELAKTTEERKHSWLNEEGVKKFQITGPVYACPVRLGGLTEAILVTWMNPKSCKLPVDLAEHLDGLFRSSCRQVLRIANFVANDRFGTEELSAEHFLDKLVSSLEPIDHGKVWSPADLKDAQFRRGILSGLLAALVSEGTGLKRVRVWRTSVFQPTGPDGTRKQPSEFRCVRSLTEKSYTSQGKPDSDAYVGMKADAADIYCRYTIGRFSHDPYARWQHPAMFGKPDFNHNMLDKDPQGAWIVAPIVREISGENMLYGFISADNHSPAVYESGKRVKEPKQHGAPDFREVAQQCRIMSIVADLASFVLPDAATGNGGGHGSGNATTAQS
ncbi:MAG: hypothetical protein IPJ98_16730 [Bryobacterales bacterium]|nr:hypothetical protein [Bryobacterales bacterium]